MWKTRFMPMSVGFAIGFIFQTDSHSEPAKELLMAGKFARHDGKRTAICGLFFTAVGWVILDLTFGKRFISIFYLPCSVVFLLQLENLQSCDSSTAFR